MARTIDKELTSYIGMLNLTQKKSLLSVIKSFLAPDADVSPAHIAQYNKDIAEAEIEKGEFLTHDEVVNLSKEWMHAK